MGSLEAEAHPDLEVPSIEEALLRRRRVVVRPFAPGQARFSVRAVWRASGPVNPAVDVALGALGDARR